MKIHISKESMRIAYVKARPFLAVVLLQAMLAGLDVISKAALNEGMSNYVFVVYRHAIATIFIAPFALAFEKKTRPRMSISVFSKIMLLGLLEAVIDQNLYFMGMKYTTATFANAMSNVLPAIAFLMAWLLRLEKIKLRSKHSQAKITGTLTTVGGAMIMILVRGPILRLPWTKEGAIHAREQGEISAQHPVKGAVMVIIGCFCWSWFMILQVITLQTYPAELSLTAWICLLGTAEGAILALVMEKKRAAWYLKWDTNLLAVVYSGVLCSGLAYYVQGVVLNERGPVFVTAFSPLGMVIVAILSSFIFAEEMCLGRVVGAIVIIIGLYLVIWGKSKDYKSPIIDAQQNPSEDALDGESIHEEVIDVK